MKILDNMDHLLLTMIHVPGIDESDCKDNRL